jgi:hypothetical protein
MDGAGCSIRFTSGSIRECNARHSIPTRQIEIIEYRAKCIFCKAGEDDERRHFGATAFFSVNRRRAIRKDTNSIRAFSVALI